MRGRNKTNGFTITKRWEINPVAEIDCENCKESGIKTQMVYEFPRLRYMPYIAGRWVVCPRCRYRDCLEKK